MNPVPLPLSMLIASLVLPVAAGAEETVATQDRSAAMAYVDDSVITTKIKAKLAEDTLRSLVHISVDTDRQGIVTLGGNARSQADADRAVAIARGTEGVTGVNSAIQIKVDD